MRILLAIIPFTIAVLAFGYFAIHTFFLIQGFSWEEFDELRSEYFFVLMIMGVSLLISLVFFVIGLLLVTGKPRK